MAEVDVEKQVAFWRKEAEEAWATAQDLVERDRRISFGLFFAHLTLEKIIKAHVWRVRKIAPPKVHNLIRLAEIAEISLDETNKKVLAEINEFNIAGRYSDMLLPPPSFEEAKQYLQRAKGTFEWLKNLL
jgi:HEPN domain-containing protein